MSSKFFEGGAGPAASAAAKTWTANAAVKLDEMLFAPAAAGGFAQGDLMRSLAGRSTGAIFDAAEAACFVGVDADTEALAAAATADDKAVAAQAAAATAKSTADKALVLLGQSVDPFTVPMPPLPVIQAIPNPSIGV